MLADVCTELEKSIRDSVPQPVDAHFDTLWAMQPREAFSEAAKQVFVQGAPFSTVLTGVAAFASDAVDIIAQKLPVFVHTMTMPDSASPPAAFGLLSYIAKVERVMALAGWWQEAQPTVRPSHTAPMVSARSLA